MNFEQRRIKEHVQKQIKKFERGGSEYSLYRKGFSYIENGKFEAALKHFSEIIIKNSKLPLAFFGRCCVYLSLGKIEECLNDINTAIELKSDRTDIYPALYAFRGFVYFINNNIEKALNDLDKSLELDSTQQEPYNLRGAIYKFLDKNEDSLNNFSKAIEIDSNSFDSYSGRALTYVSLKRYDEAANDFNKVIELVDSREDKKFFASLAYSLFLAEQQFDLAKLYIDKIFEQNSLLTANESLNKQVYLENIKKAKEIHQKNQELEEKNRRLTEEYKAEIEENRRFKYLSATASDIVHQINQPIGAMRLEITGARQRIIDGKFKPERINPLLERVFEQLERLNNIITQFRSYANGKIECNQMNLNDIVIKILSRFKSEFPDHSIKLIDILETPAPFAMVNAFLLGEVLFNLLNNAKDALENIDNSTIWIKTWQTSDGRNGIDIEDNGAGVSPDVLEKLFLPFSTTKTAQKGLGLGLFLSRTNIEKLGGELTYKPRENGGSCFSICFLNTSKKELEHEQTI